MGQESRIQRQTKEEHEMSDEYRPDDEPGRKATEDEVEAHGPVGLGPTGMGPTAEGPTAEGPTAE